MINNIVDFRDVTSPSESKYIISNVNTLVMMMILFPLCLVKGFLRMRVSGIDPFDRSLGPRIHHTSPIGYALYRIDRYDLLSETWLLRDKG